MTPEWLERLMVQSAFALEAAGKTLFQFGPKIRQALDKTPVQPWEAAAWARGLNSRLIRQEGYFFRVGTGRHSCLSFFVRNEDDLYVGLRREAITQAATYVMLVTEQGFAPARVRVESRWMDVAVRDDQGGTLLYAENKASAAVLEKLCRALEDGFSDGVPFAEDDSARVDDSVRKAQHIWLNRPQWFWAVAPTARRPYVVNYSAKGFSLQAVSSVPTALEWDA